MVAMSFKQSILQEFCAFHMGVLPACGEGTHMHTQDKGVAIPCGKYGKQVQNFTYLTRSHSFKSPSFLSVCRMAGLQAEHLKTQTCSQRHKRVYKQNCAITLSTHYVVYTQNFQTKKVLGDNKEFIGHMTSSLCTTSQSFT